MALDVGKLTQEETSDLFKKLLPNILDDDLIAILDNELSDGIKEELFARWDTGSGADSAEMDVTRKTPGG